MGEYMGSSLEGVLKNCCFKVQKTKRCVTKTLLPLSLTMAPACAKLDLLVMTLPELSSHPLLETGVHLPHCLLRLHRDRPVGRSHHLQDQEAQRVPAGNEEPLHELRPVL